MAHEYENMQLVRTIIVKDRIPSPGRDLIDERIVIHREYDRVERRILSFHYNESDLENPIQKELIQFDEAFRVARRETLSAEEIYEYESYEYDETGRLIYEEHYNPPRPFNHILHQQKAVSKFAKLKN